MGGEIGADFAAHIADGGLDKIRGPHWRSLILYGFYQLFWVHSLLLYAKLLISNSIRNRLFPKCLDHRCHNVQQKSLLRLLTRFSLPAWRSCAEHDEGFR